MNLSVYKYLIYILTDPPTVKLKFEETKSSRELQCIPEGIPDRYFFSQWEHKSEYLEHIRFLPDNGSGKLVIPFVSGETDRHNDKGIYTCNVSNNVSFRDKRFISAQYFLYASGKFCFSSNCAKPIRLLCFGSEKEQKALKSKSIGPSLCSSCFEFLFSTLKHLTRFSIHLL